MLGKDTKYRLLYVAVLAALTAVPAHSAGFGVFQQGAKAMGMAGAFTAQADDPSAMFHNVGGLAHQRERAFQVGATLVSLQATDFEGVAPGLGAGAREESEPLLTAPAHFYWVEPLNDRWTFGLAVNSPFGLTSEWKASDFSGRLISRMASLATYDVSPNLAWRASNTLGFGFGVIARFSEIELLRNIPSFDPATAQIVDVAELYLESDLDSGVGFQVGVSSHPNNSWSWGLSYRSKIEVDFSGDGGRLRQILTSNAGLDALIAATFPLDTNLALATRIEFPDMASLGLAVRPSREWLVEVDCNWTGWSSLAEFPILLPGHSEFDQTLPQNWEDVFNYRLGFSHSGAGGSEWRFGLSFDETPQPLEALGPILPDGNQTGLTLGYGFRKPSLAVDLALMYVDIEERTTRVNTNNFNGSYDSSGFLFASTLTW